MITRMIRILVSTGLISLYASSAAAETQLNGIIEVEGGLALDSRQRQSSDISLATLELGINHQMNNQIGANIVLLHEDYDTDPAEVDQATVTINTNNNYLQFILGRQYVPFGSFDTAMVSDPLPQEIGETRETAIGIIAPIKNVSLQAFVFKGNVTTNWKPNWTTRISIEKKGKFSFSLDTYYINELTNIEIMSAEIDGSKSLSRSVPGAGAAIHLSMNDYHLKAECLGAIRKYSVDEMNSSQPAACHYELSTTLTSFQKETQIVASYGLTKQAAGLELPLSRIGAAISFQLNQNTALSTEWILEHNYTDGINSPKPSNNFVTQIAYNF